MKSLSGLCGEHGVFLWAVLGLLLRGLIVVWDPSEWCTWALQPSERCHWPGGPHVHAGVGCWGGGVGVCHAAAVLPRSHDPGVQLWVRGRYRTRGGAAQSRNCFVDYKRRCGLCDKSDFIIITALSGMPPHSAVKCPKCQFPSKRSDIARFSFLFTAIYSIYNISTKISTVF